MTAAVGKKDLWQEALEQLRVEDRDEIKSTEKLESLKLLRNVARSKKEDCIENGWSIYQKDDGTHVKLRHILEKIAGIADQIIAVGTLGVGFDTSGYAAAPWAVVKMLISGATSNIKVFTDLGEGLETVTDALERFAIVEKLYLDEEAAIRQQVDEKITKLYASILVYLAAAKRYFAASTLKKIAKGIKDSVMKQHEELKKSISAAEGDLDKWVKVANARVLHDVRKSLGDVNQKMTLQLAIAEDNLNKNQRQKILQWLSTISYTSQHSLASRNLLESSGLWLLNCKEFVDWEDSPDSSVLWLHGSSGTGKTSLVSQVIDYLVTSGARNHKCPVAYFYCDRTAKPQPADPDMIMRTILKQLASSPSADEPIRLPVVAEYDKRAGGLAANDELVPLYVTESTELSLELCHTNPAYIVIDALDECDERRRHELIKEIDRIVSQSQKTVKVFVSSRSDTDVSLHIHKSSLASITVTSEKNQQDINRFIESEVDRLHKDGLLLHGLWSKPLRDKTIKRLKRGSQGMFRWVVLSLESLRLCKTVPDYMGRLTGLPEGLTELYDILFADIRESGEGALKTAELVLSFLKVDNPTIAEVVDAAFGLDDDGDGDDGSDDSSDDSSDDGSNNSDLAPLQPDYPLDSKALDERAQLVVNICRNLVMIDVKNNTFRFSHPSVDDYLMTLVSFRADKRHARLLNRCLAELMRNQWLDIPRYELLNNTVMKGNTPYGDFWRYSVFHWVIHCGGVSGTPSETDEDLSAALSKFLFPTANKFTAGLKLLRALAAHYMLRRLVFLRLDMADYIVGEAEIKSSNSGMGNEPEEFPIAILHIVALTGFTSILDKALPDKSDIDSPSAGERTALSIAVEYGRFEMVKELLGRGADPGAGDTNTDAPLHYAAAAGNVQIAEMLLATGKCDINLAHRGKTPLMTALVNGEHGMAQLLLCRPEIDLTDPALFPNAVVHSSGGILQELLRQVSVDLNAPCEHILDPGAGRTTLLLPLAIKARNKSTVKALLDDKRVDLAALDDQGWTAHSHAAVWADANILDIFFNHPRVNVNEVNKRGNTALHFAVIQRQLFTVKFLLAHPKVRVDVYNEDGCTPLDIAITTGNSFVADLIGEHPGATLVNNKPDGGVKAVAHGLSNRGSLEFMEMIHAPVDDEEGE